MFEQFKQEMEQFAADYSAELDNERQSNNSKNKKYSDETVVEFDSTKSVAQHLYELAIPARTFKQTPITDKQDTATKIRGTPWWPKGQPRPKDSLDEAMVFLGQINLADITAASALSGILVVHISEHAWHKDGTPEWQLNYFTDSITPDAQLTAAESYPLEKKSVRCLPSINEPSLDALSNYYYDEFESDDFYADYEKQQQIDFEGGACGGSYIGGHPQWWQDPKWPTSANSDAQTFIAYFGMLDDGNPVENIYLFLDSSNSNAPKFNAVVQGT